jgi:hypothetical protein
VGRPQWARHVHEDTASSTELTQDQLLVLHDDPEREFDYVDGAEDALTRAEDRDWTVVSMATDWATVFPEA